MMTENDSAELEEGECSDLSDQDDVGMSTSETRPDPKAQPASYRQGSIPQIIINSDQSDQDDSDDDGADYLSHGKRSCRSSYDKFSYSTSQNFVNPLRSPEFAQGGFKKRRNNVWGAVMTEQILSQDIKKFGVNAPLTGADRDVESYDITLSKEDDRPEFEAKENANEVEDIFGSVVDLEKEVKKHQNRKRKRNIKERLGIRVVHDDRKLDPLNITDREDKAEVTRAIIDAMQEQNIALFTRIIDAINTEKAIDLYNKTVDVENSGGMMINNGYRRRTPGGVYIQLLKSESSIPEDVISGLFEEENQRWVQRKAEIRKIKKAARKKGNKAENRSNMDLDRPETPTPTRELEDLDNENFGNDAEVDADTSDLPDRPDTPEPNDSSDNDQSEQDDEEDITVAIAKARAAILKKQKAIAESENQIADSESRYESVEMS